jgi:predicted O-linked N-acetylglucosamine transferase (SPINDLY family)
MSEISIQEMFQQAAGLQRAGRLADAETLCRQILQRDPERAEVLHLLGILAMQSARPVEAVELIRRATFANPSAANYHCNLGVVLANLGQIDAAVAAYRKAIALQPNMAEAHNNLASALRQLEELDESIAECEAALVLRPEYLEAHNNLGNALKDMGRIDDAIAAYRRGLAIDPRDAAIHSNIIFAQLFLGHLSDSDLQREPEIWNQQHARPLGTQIHPSGNDRSPNRRLRIGYVSADFREHSCAYYLAPLLANHDHAQFEIFCYAQVPVPDALTRRFEKYADHWCNTTNLADEELAEQIRADQIDILVDLMLHTASNRLLVFARKPAPVQVSWLGYPGSSGVETIEWRISDSYMDPSSQKGVIQLPDCIWCNSPPENQPEVGELPALKNGYVTFGCQNNFCKVSDRTLELWAGAMLAVENSRLLLVAPPGAARRHVLEVLARRGVDSGRVAFFSRVSLLEYFRQYNQIDIGLDTIPYNGHATTFDALSMGVPVVTRVGATLVGRAGWSQLNNLGKTQWAARSDEEFAPIAAGLAGDLPRLGRLRRELRGQLRASPLCDGPKFARNMENGFRQMWRHWCEEK